MLMHDGQQTWKQCLQSRSWILLSSPKQCLRKLLKIKLCQALSFLLFTFWIKHIKSYHHLFLNVAMKRLAERQECTQRHQASFGTYAAGNTRKHWNRWSSTSQSSWRCCVLCISLFLITCQACSWGDQQQYHPQVSFWFQKHKVTHSSTNEKKASTETFLFSCDNCSHMLATS